MLTYYLFLFCAGLFSGLLLFSKKAQLPTPASIPRLAKVSVIIPARNEEKNIANLLTDLQTQTLQPFEIICVDDNSTDNTPNTIQSFSVVYKKITQKPKSWTGKTFACETGAKMAKGEIFVFIDADVRLAPSALAQIVTKLNRNVISVQPFHAVYKPFQQFAFFFNAIGLAGNGVFCRFTKKKAGLFGPVIAMPRACFTLIGGYEKVAQSVIEDVALGKVFQQHGIETTLFAGDEAISFTMYQTMNDLIIGFTKNFSSGAAQTPLLLLVLTFFWVTALTTVPIVLLQGLFTLNLSLVLLGVFFYLLFMLHLFKIATYTGSFKKRYIAAFPALLAVFHFVFFYSIYARFVLKKVTWKGREISLK